MKNKTSALNYYKVIKAWKDNREIWRTVLGYEGLYKVSNRGAVYSMTTDKLRKLHVREGYKYVRLSKDGKEKSVPVHRLVAKAFIPNPENLATVNHKDFDKTNNDVRNLEWMSNLDNIMHAKAGGRLGGQRKDYTKIKARICSKCYTMKPIEEFRYRSLECRCCEKKRQNGYYLKRREKIFANNSQRNSDIR